MCDLSRKNDASAKMKKNDSITHRKWGSHQHNNIWRGNRPTNNNSDLRPATRELAPTTVWIETGDWSEYCIQEGKKKVPSL